MQNSTSLHQKHLFEVMKSQEKHYMNSTEVFSFPSKVVISNT